jgi:hypothetical protein
MDGNVFHKEGVVLDLTQHPSGINFLEFSLDCDPKARFFLGGSNAMTFIVVENPQLVSLVYNEACHAHQPLILVFQSFGLC